MAVPIAIGIIAGVLFFGDFILSLSKDSFAQAKESKYKNYFKEFVSLLFAPDYSGGKRKTRIYKYWSVE